VRQLGISVGTTVMMERVEPKKANYIPEKQDIPETQEMR